MIRFSRSTRCDPPAGQTNSQTSYGLLLSTPNPNAPRDQLAVRPPPPNSYTLGCQLVLTDMLLYAGRVSGEKTTKMFLFFPSFYMFFLMFAMFVLTVSMFFFVLVLNKFTWPKFTLFFRPLEWGNSPTCSLTGCEYRVAWRYKAIKASVKQCSLSIRFPSPGQRQKLRAKARAQRKSSIGLGQEQ